MKTLFKGLDNETQYLVAVGSAVAAGCIPCLESISSMARQAGIDEKKLRTAAIIGQFVKDQPALHMKTAADNLLGTHLHNQKVSEDCPFEGTQSVQNNESIGSINQQPCACAG